jgi:hypothetical protein
MLPVMNGITLVITIRNTLDLAAPLSRRIIESPGSFDSATIGFTSARFHGKDPVFLVNRFDKKLSRRHVEVLVKQSYAESLKCPMPL